LEWVEVGRFGVEFVWNGDRWAEEILIFGRELGLDMLKWDVGVRSRLEQKEYVWIGGQLGV
jgi:hypothetical protein